jgi:Na+-driven multidrug efflux pump
MLWSITGPVLKYLGNDVEISNAAWSYALILMCALPGRITFRNISAYFGAMKILKPSVRSSIIGITVNLAVGLPLVVGWPFSLKEDGFKGYGFYACPVVTTCVEYCMMIFMIY